MVDTGNNNVISTLPKGNFQAYDCDFDGDWPQGRFSNGKILLAAGVHRSGFWTEVANVPAYLDPNYGITDFATGVCFASIL
ncbi:unnamed protein product [Linum tenue]|uniref:Uncharacterized protein n=1 Tax=Linum tenue TaxID=586396 RepID=A0AAV0MK21_9ROSI|nr:unnamed protein product [Linum tenue]